MIARDLPACICGSTTPGVHGPGCPRSPSYRPRYRAALVIGRPDRVATQRLPRFDAGAAAAMWLGQLRGGGR